MSDLSLPLRDDTTTKLDVVDFVMGGIGNQLFQYVFGKGLARRLGADLTFDVSFYGADPYQNHSIIHRLEPSARITTETKAPSEGAFALGDGILTTIDDRIVLPSTARSLWLKGYWQDENLLDRTIVAQTYAAIVAAVAAQAPVPVAESIRGARDSIAIHLRRRDYGHMGVCEPSYYVGAIDLLRARFPHAELYVFADEPNYAQHLLGSRYGNVTMVNSGGDLMDLYLMSLCQHFIIANSTFSWWPAYFAESKGGVIICPQNWVTIPGVRSPCPARWVHVPGAVLPLAVDDRQAAVAYRVIQKALFDSAIRDWFANRGDDTLRLNFGNLGRESVVVDLGGYEGDWSQKIHKRYGSTIHIFEPLSAFADKIAERFALVENVKVHRCGLGRRDEQVRFALAADGSGAFTLGGATTELVEIREWAAFLAAQNVDVIDVLKINIEGAEFELLEHILDSGLVDRIRVLQVQFHDVVPNAVARREAIRSKLARTHRCTWCYYFVWEEWQLH